MAISNYTNPRLEVHQLMQETVTVASDHRSACVVGANYLLQRYGQEKLEPTTFSADGTAIPFVFEQQPGFDYEVDLDSVSVNAEGLEASLATFGGDEASGMKPDSVNVLGLRLTGGKLLSATTEAGIAKLDTKLAGLPVQLGDVVWITAEEGDTPRRRVVTGLLGVEGTPSSQVGMTSNTVITPTASGTFTGKEDTTYVVRVESVSEQSTSWAGVTLRVSDTAGIDISTQVVLDSATPTVQLGTLGVSVTLAAVSDGSLAAGDTFSVICYAAKTSDTEFDGIILNAMPVDLADRSLASLHAVEFRKEYSGSIPSDATTGNAWEVTTNGVIISENIALNVPGRAGNYVPFVNGVGEVYVSYRALIIPMDKDEDVVLIASTADIQENFGTIAPENELAYGCSCALTGSEGRPIFAIRTAGTGADAFYNAVKKTEADDSVYSFAILTDEVAVMDRVVEFNLAQSEPEVMKWRKTIFGVDAPGEYRVAAHDVAGNPINAVFAANTDGRNTIVQITESTEFSLRDVQVNSESSQLRAGDKVQFLATGEKYTIASVLSEKELVLVDGPITATAVATPIALWKADTPQNAAEYVTFLAKHFHNRRVAVVWCDHGTSDQAPRPVPNAFLAAEVAGLCSRVEPQQGITKFEIHSIDAAPRMYTQHTVASLDNIAKEGVMVITQQVKGGPCFIRHQLTTETDKGILYSEDSCTRNLDAISYSVAEVLERYIGKANVVRSALSAIELDIRTTLDYYTTNATSDLVGAALVSWDGLTVQQHSVFKDRVIVNVNLYLPAPLNVIQVYEMAFIADLSLTETA